MPQLGSVIDKFQLIEGPFSGSFGDVYRAKHIDTQEIVALKFAKDSQDVVLRQRFQLENDILHKLSPHDNVVAPKSTIINDSNTLLYAMEYLEDDLRAVLASMPHSNFDDRIAVFKQICDGLNHAHTNSIFHRDLHEGNVRFPSGEINAKVTDFGLGKDLAAMVITSKPFVVGGDYVKPPELIFQITDAPSDDQFTRADMYALGVMLFSLFNSSQPHFFSTRASIVSYINALNPGNPTQFFTLPTTEKLSHYQNWLQAYDRNIQNTLNLQIPDIDRGLQLSVIIKKMCNPDFNLRYASINDMLSDLGGVS